MTPSQNRNNTGADTTDLAQFWQLVGAGQPILACGPPLILGRLSWPLATGTQNSVNAALSWLREPNLPAPSTSQSEPGFHPFPGNCPHIFSMVACRPRGWGSVPSMDGLTDDGAMAAPRQRSS